MLSHCIVYTKYKCKIHSAFIYKKMQWPRLQIELYILKLKKSKKDKRHVYIALVCLSCHSKSIKRERRKADSNYDREQTRDCICGGDTPRLTTLCGSRGSSSLFLQWFRLLLVCPLFLCKPRKPTCVILKLSCHMFHMTIHLVCLKTKNLVCACMCMCMCNWCFRQCFEFWFNRNS